MDTIAAIEAGQLIPAGADLTRLLSLYQGEISYLDQHIGQLLESLETLGLAQNTIVALTGDHGESFDEHSALYVRGEFFHPHSLYNTELAVPLILRYPDKLRAGTTATAISQSVDLLPTLLDMSGLPSADQVQGSSLVDFLNGSSHEDRAVFATMYDFAFCSAATFGWKLVLNRANGQMTLFDLVNDPGELRDVAAEHPEAVKTLAGRLHAWMRQENVP